MFKKEMPQNIKNTETVIGESVVLEGEFNSHGNIVLEGKLNGNLSTDGHVLIGDKAEVVANIKAGSAFISGKVIGNITLSDSIDIAKTANIQGDIKASSIAVESGCQINGRVSVGSKIIENPKKTTKQELPLERGE
ncbi:MAG TPA: polymer-forming cytoskeletal protein [bacterium]|jgi:cytoskeletal protein CcmA (bactofilin family)|nr:polymer-forming cytoskeletal protein [bacterium]HOG38506.1 polymer-forming cytoskeletal protein [bacterium]HQI03487.1 polymer-forming cytoskeletal protein [bacterium]